MAKQKFHQKEMSYSDENVFLTLRQSSFGNCFGPLSDTVKIVNI